MLIEAFTLPDSFTKRGSSIGAIDYLCPDIINIAYAEGEASNPDWCGLEAEAQWPVRAISTVSGITSFRETVFGSAVWPQIRSACDEGAVVYRGCHACLGDVTLQNPWSGYPGYTSVQVQDFFRAGEGAFLIRAGYDFPWVEGLSAYALGVFGTTRIKRGSFGKTIRFQSAVCAKKGCLEDLSLRLRYALVHQYGGDVDNLTDFRVICNYMIKF